MYPSQYMNQNQVKQEHVTAPAVLAIVMNIGLLYLLASGLGVVPSPLPPVVTSMFDIAEQHVVPPPPVDRTLNPNDLVSGPVVDAPPQTPVFQLTSEIDPPVGEGPTTILIEDGGHVVDTAPLVASPRIVKSFEPPYPLFSRANDEEGVVYLKVSISPYGVVSDAQVERSSGFSRLDDAALKSIRSWRFAPATRGSQAIASWVTVPVRFVLHKNR